MEMVYRSNTKNGRVAGLQGEKSYVTERDRRDLIFDLNGRFIKATKK